MHFKDGQAVWLHGQIKAEVLGVLSNGIWIGYWGRGLKEGQWCRQRVAARYLTPREVAA